MAITNPGIKQIAMCDLGTLATTPNDVVVSGIRNAATMKHSAFKPIKDAINGSWRGKKNINITSESIEATMFALKKHIEWLNGNCDVQVVRYASENSSPVVHTFDGSNVLGIDFEYLNDGDKITLKTILEAAFPYSEFVTLWDGADNATAVDVGFAGRGETPANVRRPFFVAFESPKATTVLTRREIAKRSYSIKTKSKKSEEDNMSIVNYISFDIMLSFRNATIAKQLEIIAKDNAPSLYIKENNLGSFFDAFDFAAGVLTLDDEFEDGDDDAISTLHFTRDVHVSDITFNTDATHGGDATHLTGAEGGTMIIGA